MNDACQIKVLNGVEVQENGIVRNSKGRIIARLVDSVEFDSEHLELTKPLEKTDVYGLAIESGFMLSTQHGQAEHKLMPVTDGDTLMALVKAIEERHGIK